MAETAGQSSKSPELGTDLRSKYANGLTGAKAHRASDEAAKDIPALLARIDAVRELCDKQIHPNHTRDPYEQGKIDMAVYVLTVLDQ